MIKTIYEIFTGKPWLDFSAIKKNGVNLSEYENIKIIDEYKGARMMQYNCVDCGKENKTSVKKFEENKAKSCFDCHKKGYIYFITERDTNKIKIGLSSNLISRLTGQYGGIKSKQFDGLESEFDINKDESFYIETIKKDMKYMESYFQDNFQEYRLKNYGKLSGKTEWFDNADKILQKIKMENILIPLRQIYKSK